MQYACRKTLADSRPRVRGRFAKNDEFGETTTTRTTCSNHEEDTDEDARSIHVCPQFNSVLLAPFDSRLNIFSQNLWKIFHHKQDMTLYTLNDKLD